MFKRLFSAALVFGAAAIAPPAMAQTVTCLPRDALVSSLETAHGERLTGGGLQNQARVIEPRIATRTLCSQTATHILGNRANSG